VVKEIPTGVDDLENTASSKNLWDLLASYTVTLTVP
jgi:hypothetical protein